MAEEYPRPFWLIPSSDGRSISSSLRFISPMSISRDFASLS
jgi:hypothetical protein